MADNEIVGQCVNCGEDLVKRRNGCIVHPDENEDPDQPDYGWYQCLGSFAIAELEEEVMLDNEYRCMKCGSRDDALKSIGENEIYCIDCLSLWAERYLLLKGELE